MEKLQHALEIARKRRSEASQAETRPAVPSHSSPSPRAAPTDVEAAWAALTPADLDTEHLTRNRILSLTDYKPKNRGARLNADAARSAFDILRTKIRLSMEKNGWRRLAITSASQACGKTTLACNLATGFARQSELRVIVFEFDLRQPDMHKMLGVAPHGNIEDMLRGRIGFADQALRVGETVAVSLAGRPSGEPGNLMLSHQTLERIAEIEAAYKPDLLIFDLPPFLVSEDARAFLRNVDCALLAASAEASTVKEIDVCERDIAEQTNVLGIVLNKCRYEGEVSEYGVYT